MIVTIPVSVGEMLDKLTILEIKLEKIDHPQKLEHIATELGLLQEAMPPEVKNAIADPISDAALALEFLKLNNQALWILEDLVRACEHQQRFPESYGRATRNIYIINDLRAKLKRELNKLFDSEIVEVKSYQ